MNASQPPLRVRIEPSGIELEVAPGERVLDALDEWPNAGLPLACRAGNCAACLTLVRGGADLLEPAAPPEQSTLVEAGALGPGYRLGCQLRVAAAAAGQIWLEVLSAGTAGPKSSQS